MIFDRLVLWWHTTFERDDPSEGDPRTKVIMALHSGAALNTNYIVLILASCAIATFGLLENSPAVIIGAMIIAPLMPVIQATAFSALEGDAPEFLRSAITLAVGILLAIILSMALARLVGISEFGSEILSRVRPNLLDLGIALGAGIVGAFARVRPSVSSAVAGTAIAVALMPPLCVVGIGISQADWTISSGALLLFLTNLLGITLASMVVFLLNGYVHFRSRAPLLWAAGLTALIVIPLALSLQTLVRESALETALKRALTTETVTFRQAELVSSTFDWHTSPPTATLLVRSSESLTPHQVGLLEAFAFRATGQRFRLVMDISQVQRVTESAVMLQPVSPDAPPTAPPTEVPSPEP
jgi:uncharacterized hydrophobic protein (TIGR00271 family)